MFRGEVLSVGELLERSMAAPAYVPGVGVGVRHTAASNARECVWLLARGESLDSCWRFGILQTLDDYTSTLQRGGVMVAAGVFTDPPPMTGSLQVDAGFAALADHLAERDGWQAPAWTADPARHAGAWYPDVPVIFKAEADRDSPRAFRQRGIFVTASSLARA